MNNRIDFKRIADAALGRAHTLVPQWLPGGETAGAEYKCLNPTRSDHRKGSFSINLVTGIWFDFATGDGGGDLISLYAYIHHLSQLDAAKAVAEQLGMALNSLPGSGKEDKPPDKPARKRSAWMPVLPVPEGAPPVPVAHPVRGRSDSSWDYFDQEGRLLGAVHRFKTSDGGKEVLPCVFLRSMSHPASVSGAGWLFLSHGRYMGCMSLLAPLINRFCWSRARNVWMRARLRLRMSLSQ